MRKIQIDFIMRPTRPRVLRVALCFSLFFLIFWGSRSSSLAQAPGWSRGQQNLAISYDECMRRALAALQAEGYRRDDQPGGNFAVGIKGVHTAVIICGPAPEARMLVQIVVASNGEGGGTERQRLQAQMERPGASGGGGSSQGVGGCTGTAGYSATIDSNTFRMGSSIEVRVTVPVDNPPEGSWVGIFKGETALNWSYLTDLKTSKFTRRFPVPMETGQFQVRVLLDNGYNKVAVHCNFTVQ